MPNKNYVIGGFVILAVIGGAIFWSRDNSLTPNASVLERGANSLTRDSATKMIETYFKVSRYALSVNQKKFFRYDDKLGHYTEDAMGSDVQIFKDLETAGFIKIVAEKDAYIEGSPSSYPQHGKNLTFDFTEQAKPYFIKQGDSAPDTNYVALVKAVNVEVTGITDGANTRIADYTVQYEQTPIGKIINEHNFFSERNANEKVKEQKTFVLYDDGWRIAQ